jgi:hypothetical protein
MKVSRPTHGSQSGLTAKVGTAGEIKGKSVAARLAEAGHTGGARRAERAAAPRSSSAVSDIGADLKAGKITAQAALDKVVERVLDRQLGKKAAAGLREKVGAALRESLADDPLLAAKVRALGQE